MNAEGYTVDELVALKTIGFHWAYGEQKIDTDHEKVYLNGRRIAVDWYDPKYGSWRLTIY